MKSLITLLMLVGSTAFGAGAEVGQKAPDFKVVGQDGKTYSLADYKGQHVVLEWYNQGCPYVRKHYDAHNMQSLQTKATSDKNMPVTWLTIVSSAEGKQGYLSPEAAKIQFKTEGMKSQALLLDVDGAVGKAYGAKTTPHMFVINPMGNVIYAGAIDSNSSADSKDIPGSTNYITKALADAKANRKVATSSTKPYGCSVKYE